MLSKHILSLESSDLESEMKTVLESLLNERNTTLLSVYFLKRARLIHNVFDILKHDEENSICYYIDIANTQTLDELGVLFAKIVAGKDNVSLKGTFHHLSVLEKRVYIAIDNFQQILQYPEKGVDALLRSYVEESTNATFIFAGNNERKMYEMFVSPAKPFYQSTQILRLP